MGTQKSQPVNIIVNIDSHESLDETRLCLSLERMVGESLQRHVRVRIVRKSLETAELPAVTTPSPTVNMVAYRCPVCRVSGFR